MDQLTQSQQQAAKLCVIWMHGLGADASDMKGLADNLLVTSSVHHVFLAAPLRPVTINGGAVMPAWYDISGANLTDRQDEAGILASNQQLIAAIKTQMDKGFSSRQIVVAGFSQGGAMALYGGLTFESPLAGILSLSAYLPLASQIKPVQSFDTPIMMAFGDFDPVVNPLWSKQSLAHIQSWGYHLVQQHHYPMGHAVCHQELHDISIWLTQLISGASNGNC